MVRCAGWLSSLKKAEYDSGRVYRHYRLKLPSGGSFSVRLARELPEGWYYLEGLLRGGSSWAVFYPEVAVPTTREFARSFAPSASFSAAVVRTYASKTWQTAQARDKEGFFFTVVNLSPVALREGDRIKGKGELEKKGRKIKVVSKEIDREELVWLEE
jgi:hypothetical protein